MRMIDYNTLGRQGPPTGEMGLPPQLGKILEETLLVDPQPVYAKK